MMWGSEASQRRVLSVAALAGGYALYALWKKRRAKALLPVRACTEKEVVGKPPGEAWTAKADCSLMRGFAEEGPASWEPETVAFHIERLAKNQTPAVAYETERSGEVEYVEVTWEAYVSEIKAAARAMIKLGLKRRMTCAILGFNSREWVVADLAAVLAGGFATGIYATNGPESVKYILDHSKAAICVVEGPKQAAKVQGYKVALVSYGEDAPGALSWSEFLARGRDRADMPVASPGDCCTLIYTSGTTGEPKAVMISNDSITWIVRAFASSMHFGKAKHEKLVSYLPLSHIAAQAIDIYANLVTVGRRVGDAQFGCEVRAATVYFARPDALKGSLKLTLCAVRPTVFFGVPRVFEKFAEALQAVGAKTTGVKKILSTWAKATTRAKYDRLRADSQAWPGLVALLQEPLAMVLLKKVHAAIGLDRAHFVFTGAAPIAQSTLEYFGSLGFIVNEAFGMSEVTGPASVTLNSYFVPGTCGPAAPGLEIKLDSVEGRDKDDEGEVCFRGRSLMLGYLNNEAKTRETIDDDGWLHSGDTGRLVECDGNTMLKITGRIKELLITAGGENVAPVPIEDALKGLLPGVSAAVVVGDKLKFLSVLFTLKQLPDDATGSFFETLAPPASDLDPNCATAAQAADSPKWQRTVQDAIDEYNSNLAVSAAQKIHKFAILPLDFSQATGELTPTLKLKRAAVVDKYGPILKTLYGAHASAVWA